MVCTQCQPIEAQISADVQQIQAIENSPGYIQGPNDPHPGRPDPESLMEVKALWRQVATLSRQLDDCVIQKCGGKPDLNSTFPGTATLTIPAIPISVPNSFAMGLLFHKYFHAQVDITSFSTPPFPVPGTSDTVTVSMSGRGYGTYASGTLELTLPLHFHNSLWYVPDSDVTFFLSTAGGQSVDSAGNATLTGNGTFSGGRLNGDAGTLTLAGTITPPP
jgi:hypothetical protein